MKASTVKEIQLELEQSTQPELVALCLRLAKFKKENKELLTYLLFESFDQEAYLRSVKDQMDQQFGEINMSSPYFIKKSLRKILRTAAKYIRYTGTDTFEVQLLIHFCQVMLEKKMPLNKSTALMNIYQSQLKKIEKAIKGMHEDLQYDFLKELQELRS